MSPIKLYKLPQGIYVVREDLSGYLDSEWDALFEAENIYSVLSDATLTEREADLDEAWARWMSRRPVDVPEGRCWLPHSGDYTRVPRASNYLPDIPAEELEVQDGMAAAGAKAGAAGEGRAPLPV